MNLNKLKNSGGFEADFRPNPLPLPVWEYWSAVALIILLVLIGGLVAGLTIGIMSLDTTNIAILKRSGTLAERKYA